MGRGGRAQKSADRRYSTINNRDLNSVLGLNPPSSLIGLNSDANNENHQSPSLIYIKRPSKDKKNFFSEGKDNNFKHGFGHSKNNSHSSPKSNIIRRESHETYSIYQKKITEISNNFMQDVSERSGSVSSQGDRTPKKNCEDIKEERSAENECTITSKSKSDFGEKKSMD